MNHTGSEQAERRRLRDERPAPSSRRPTATVLRSPSTNHPRIHALHSATFDATGVCAPACGSAESRRDLVAAGQSRNPQYRATSADVTCENPRCGRENGSAAPGNDDDGRPGVPCQ